MQDLAVDPTKPIESLLRHTLITATRLNDSDVANWASNELNGYRVLKDIPEYRVLQGALRAFNPFNGMWIPVEVGNEEVSKMMKSVHVTLPISEVAKLACSEGQIYLELDEMFIDLFRASPQYQAGIIPRQVVQQTSLHSVVEIVRTKVLEWSLTLEIGTRKVESSHTVIAKEVENDEQEAKSISKIKLFLSHSSKDQSLAESLVELITGTLNIEDEFIRCTSVPGHRLPAGHHTSSTLKDDLKAASVVVGLLTKESLRSSYVLFELGAAWGADTPIKPLLGPDADFSDLRGPLTESNVVKLTDRSSMIQLIEELANTLGVEKKSGPKVDRKLASFLEEVTRDPKT